MAEQQTDRPSPQEGDARAFDPTDTEGTDAWGEPEPTPAGAKGAPGGAGGAGTSPDFQAMLSQLQGMISQVAAASAPALREVAAKAAELAAVAGERAGPIARTLADRTDRVGHAVADRATTFATSIRKDAEEAAASDEEPQPPAEDSPADGA